MENKSKTVAVLMSVYDKDNIDELRLAINSILEQTYHLIDLYIYSDGVTQPSLLTYLNEIENKTGVRIIYSKDNNGLAFALNYMINIVKHQGYGYIARMDADDISLPSRFEEQVIFLDENSDISIIGTNCFEINSEGKIIFQKKMPETNDEIKSFIVKRSPLVHPTVMFRGSIIDFINYDNKLLNTQDYYLWVELLSQGFKFHNLQSNLLLFRVASGFYKRRGVKKIGNEFLGRLYAMKKLNQYSLLNFFFVFSLLMIRLSPNCIKKFCYKYLR